MNLTQFIHFNHRCPVCEEPLTLFAQVLDKTLWMARHPSPGIIHFEQFEYKNKDYGDDDFFWMEEKGNETIINFSTPKIYQESKTWSMMFFFICNKDAVEDATSYSYGINPYVACYYRSSSFMEFKQNEIGQWQLKQISEHDKIEGNIKDEVFTFKEIRESGEEKVYILCIDYEMKGSSLRYYAIQPDDRKNKYFDSKIFEKELPMLGARPNFELSQRNKLISRFDSWILMS